MIKYAELDISKVKNLIAGVQENIKELRELSVLSFEDFHKDKRSYGLCEHHLRLALEGILTIGTHILSRLPSETKDYQEIIIGLGKYGVIPEVFAEDNKKLASYRNRMVHIYWEISEKEIYEIIKQHLGHLDKFCEYFLEYIRKENT